MNFPFYYSRKIAFSKDNRNNLSRIIIFIGRLSVAIGVVVSLITVGTGLGAKRAIKDSMADFSGHISVKSTNSNNSYNSSILDNRGFQIKKIQALPFVQDVQSYVSVSGIMRTAKNFDGIVYKGVGKNFDRARFQKFMVAGKIPVFDEKGYNNDVVISQRIAKDLELKPKDSIVTIFSTAGEKPIYRKFVVAGIYKTDIKMIDDIMVVGGINQARKILGMGKDEIGGAEIYLKNINNINKDYPAIERLVGYKNYAEKASDQYPQISDWIQIFDVNIGLIITIMLIVVIINIIMVLLILIIERTNSIGILKTMGATNFQIRSVFINYTLLIMIPGLVIGNAIGLGLLLIQKYFGVLRLNPDNYFISVVPVDFNVIYIAAISLGVLVVSAIAMILPSYLISKMSPVKSIRYD